MLSCSSWTPTLCPIQLKHLLLTLGEVLSEISPMNFSNGLGRQVRNVSLNKYLNYCMAAFASSVIKCETEITGLLNKPRVQTCAMFKLNCDRKPVISYDLTTNLIYI